MQLHTPGKSLSIGTPIPNTSVYILDDQMRPLPIGEVGSMWVGGAGVSRGYLNLPDKTAERYAKDPFVNDGSIMFNTGDLGRWRPDGQLDHMGRVDDQVKVKGFRVELDGVAAAMQTSEQVDLAVCLLVDTELWGFVTPSTASIEVVRADTARMQPYYAVPTRYLAIDQLPHTSNGKVDKRALKTMAEEQLAEELLVEVGTASPTPSADSWLSSSPSTPSLEYSMPASPTMDETPITPKFESSHVFGIHPSVSTSIKSSLWHHHDARDENVHFFDFPVSRQRRSTGA